jgi:hypothetical protein
VRAVEREVVDRKDMSPDVVSREAKDERTARKRHRGVGREGLRRDERVEPAGDEQGLGRQGAKSVRSRREG